MRTSEGRLYPIPHGHFNEPKTIDHRVQIRCYLYVRGRNGPVDNRGNYAV